MHDALTASNIYAGDEMDRKSDLGRVVAVVVTYNPEIGRLKKVVAALKGQTAGVVVSDNGSKNVEDIARVVRGRGILLRLGKNYGIGHAQNYGVKYALKRWRNARWVLTLDHDSIVSKNAIELALSKYGELAGYVKDRVGIVAIGPWKWPEEKFEEIVYNQSSGNMIKREVFEVGRLWFREDFFIECTDLEFDSRFVKKGYIMLAYMKPLMSHILGTPVKRGKKMVNYYNETRLYYFTRNLTVLALHYKYRHWISGLVTSYYRFILVRGVGGVVPCLKLFIYGVFDALTGRMGYHQPL